MAFKKINGYIIHLKEVLGRGSYGEVLMGEQESSKKKCAIKILTKALSTPFHIIVNSDEYLKNALMQEIQILQQVKSKNIVTVFEVMESANNYYIIQ
jgi:serine/threonine protein kinase